MPFSGVDNSNLSLEIQNTPLRDDDIIKEPPSFTIQSLLDKMSGQSFETGEFLSESISSKYYMPSELLEKKLPAKQFSMLHINIASLGKHIDELRTLIGVLDHPFDVIGIAETRLHDLNPLTNIDIEGYEFKHTPTGTQCGGSGMYIKSCQEFEIIQELTQSHPDISESISVELKMNGHKNIVVGCIYRHHSTIDSLKTTFFDNALKIISKKHNKICALMGDFNIDLVKYASDTKTEEFYYLLCSHNFRPFILQPTRVTPRTATLTDNIFINDISCHSLGGNVTPSISDH